MARKKLPRGIKVCEREGCNNTFIVKIGAKYQQRYCSSQCAAYATASTRKGKVHYRHPKKSYLQQPKKHKVINITQLQNCPVNYDSDGGKFAKMCNDILNGKSKFIGVGN